MLNVPIFIWLRENLFSSPLQTLLTIGGLSLLTFMISGIVDWAFVQASWTGLDRTACLKEAQGACWPFISHKFTYFIYGKYPATELWRANIALFILALGLAALIFPHTPHKKLIGLFMLCVYPVLAIILLSGNLFGLAYVPTEEWGGLLVTLVIALTGIVISLPCGVLLALGRMSDMPIIKSFCVVYIEIWRGVPLITVLFMASVMLPLFLPSGVNFDPLLRCLFGVALFSSAYMAEVVRGGLQAIPSGQYEAAKALGMSYWQAMRFIILPQALTISIPGIVNTFIGLFKDTTLVMIVGIFDLLGIVAFHYTDPNWAVPQVPITGYVFAGFVFWIFCFAMSRYSIAMENRLSTEQERN